VREFVEKAFGHAGITIRWEGQGGAEVGINSATNEAIVKVDPRYFRPTEVEHLLGDPSKAKDVLGWVPQIAFEALVKEMVEADIKLLADGRDYL